MYNQYSPMARMDGERAAVANDHPWITLNRCLDRAAANLPDETQLAGWLDNLAAIQIDDLRVYWLTVARITELTLKQAGAYADCGEFRAAGDLLVNPRAVDVYLRGRFEPVVKQRHVALSQQFAAAIGGDDPVVWLRRETLPHVRQTALLPHLKAHLQSSGFMAPAYLSGLDRRMAQVADTITFLAAWQVRDSAALYRRLQTASRADRQLIEKRFCRFALDDFYSMGADINQMVRGAGHSPFLVPLRVLATG